MPVKNLPIDTLRALVTVAELGSVTRAGEILGRSQPAVSLQLKRLEGLLNINLFHREASRLALSHDGQRLLSYAQRILSLNDEAVADFTEPDITGSIRFGIPSEFAPTLLPKILGQFSQAYPGVNLEIHCDLSKNLLQPSNRPFDLILSLENPGSGSKSTLIREDDLVWACGLKELSRDPLPLVVAPEPCMYRARALKKLKHAGLDWQVVYTSSDLSGIIAALEQGMGVTILAKQTVPKSLRILNDSSRLPNLGKIGIHLIHDRRRSNAALNRLIESVRASFE